MLARAGRIPQAQSVLDNIDADELDESGRIKLERVIEEGKGSNAVALRIAEFEKTDSLPSLMNLLDELKEKDDHNRPTDRIRSYVAGSLMKLMRK